MSTKPLIADRVLTMGEGFIPHDELENICDEHIQIFLREPNPRKWTPEIAHLEKYLPAKEQMKWQIFSMIEKHEAILEGVFEKWVFAVWNEVSKTGNTESLIDEMGVYLKERIEKIMRNDE